jgi:hypothetical protein
MILDIKTASETWTGRRLDFDYKVLCKIDTNDDRPEIFKKYELHLLQKKTGYLLTTQPLFQNLTYVDQPIAELVKDNGSLVLQIGGGENALKDNLRHCGVFEKYLNEKIIYDALFTGKHFCSFKMDIFNEEVEIYHSQFDSSSCYESNSKILIVRCKSEKDKLTNFDIRKIYYPYRHIYDKVNKKKEIIPIFINREKSGSIHIWEFKFTNYNDMSSIQQISHKKYKLVS